MRPSIVLKHHVVNSVMNWLRKYSLVTVAALSGALVPIAAWTEQPAVSAPLTPLANDGIHDPSNPALPFLQNPDESMAAFPKDRRGEVQWVETLKQGLITPRKFITGDQGEGAELQELDLDIIMKNTAQMPHVRFPHLAHTRWLTCSNCHSEIFVPKAGANSINMEKILKGQFCGRCHDKVSFALWSCERCHSVPHAGSPPVW